MGNGRTGGFVADSPRRGSSVRTFVLLGIAAGVLIFVALRFLAATTASVTGPELVLGMSDLAYSTSTLSAEAGEIQISLANTDAVSHTFTVPRLRVDVEIGSGEARRTTFNAEPGTYNYICTIPGHDTPEMRGVLTVTR